MQKVTGTMVAFVAQKGHGLVRTHDNRDVLVHITTQRKVIDGEFRRFAKGEAPPVPAPSTTVLVAIPTNAGTKLTAGKWGLHEQRPQH